MDYDLPDDIKKEIIKIAKKFDIDKIILFGSRARGDNTKLSDIDLAVKGNRIEEFIVSINEDACTLLMFDIVNINKQINIELKKEIDRNGVTIYEKI